MTKGHDERTRKTNTLERAVGGWRILGKAVECLPMTCTNVRDELRQLDWDQPRGFEYKRVQGMTCPKRVLGLSPTSFTSLNCGYFCPLLNASGLA